MRRSKGRPASPGALTEPRTNAAQLHIFRPAYAEGQWQEMPASTQIRRTAEADTCHFLHNL